MELTNRLNRSICQTIDREHLLRKLYNEKWGKLGDDDVNWFYNPKKLNKFMNEKYQQLQTVPYAYKNEGDSYFLSKDMYNSLVAICRCGRKKTEGHILKCLQRVRNEHLDNETEDENDNNDDNGKTLTMVRHARKKKKNVQNLPPTAAGIIGWPPSSYLEWERITRYVSPKTTMTGYKINERPYNNIFIG